MSTKFVKVKSITMGWNIIMYHIILLQCQINFVSSFVHTYSLRETDALKHQLCNTVCVKVFQHPSAVLDRELAADTTSGQIKLSWSWARPFPSLWSSNFKEKNARTREIEKTQNHRRLWRPSDMQSNATISYVFTATLDT